MEDNSLGDGNMMGVTLRSLLENRELLNPPARRIEKEEKEEIHEGFDVSSAFLGPNLWEKTISDFKLEYIDLDEFLAANAVLPPELRSSKNPQQSDQNQMIQHHPSQQRAPDHLTPQPHQIPQGPPALPLPPQHQPLIHVPSHSPPMSPSFDQDCSNSLRELPKGHSSISHSRASSPASTSSKKSDVAVDCKFSPTDLAMATVPGQHFDPCLQALSEDDLKPQPMVKKSKKHFVPNDLKDEKYWARRKKNNMAAKRSREARRVKENQIVLRASFLEKENMVLRDEVQKLKEENEILRSCCIHKKPH